MRKTSSPRHRQSAIRRSISHPQTALFNIRKDGYESVTADTIEPDHFNQKSYRKNEFEKF